ncbi:TonB-dependent receptor [Catalinimonas alkaloidigena]|uniref:TonB-dependent receptor n=1 Tax=Catalinimonas alkaloidigena TaxID=1075417 RepID=UPI002406A955|nr:TonB-dependent receptor [Catalinimonas alkaloidigena]MDF9794754.1 TonB-dependent receptor [Catalinimonas alkaloidigena]
MKTNLISAFLICMIAGLQTVWAQSTGTVSGQIIDAQTGEELIGATVQLEGSSTGTVTDISGNYQLKLDPGTYTLVVSYVSYASQKIEGVEVIASQNQSLDVALQEENTELQEVVVTAQAIRDNDVALLKIQKNALAVQDGISSKEMAQLGSSNAAESIKQVTGASIEDGKYVVMRGLGDRYSISQLNGVTLPSTDPYRNSTSLDLIPSDVVENMVTVKTFTPDQPGNFTGGKVDITTKSLPEEFFFNFGLSATYNTKSSFINNFLTDGAEGELDFLGYDDGTRALPDAFTQHRERIGNPALAGGLERAGRAPANQEQRDIIEQTSNAFETPFLATQQSVPLNHGVDISVGNRTTLFGKNLGYSAAISYDKSYTFYDDGTYGLYFDAGTEELRNEQSYDVVNGDENTQLGGIISIAYQFSPNHEITLENLYNHDNLVNARTYNGYWQSFRGGTNFEDRIVSFQERELNNTQLRGRHFFKDFLNGAKLEWTAGYALSTQEEPDIRLAGFGVPGYNRGYSLNQSEIGILPSRIYRNLEDNQLNGKVDITIPLSQEQSDNQLKFGGYYSNKQRDFREDFVSIVSQNQNLYNPDFTTFSEAGEDDDISDFFALNNFGLVNTPESTGTGFYGFGNYYADQTFSGNIYEGTEEIWATYLMAAYNVTNSLKLIGGARVESTDFTAEASNGRTGGIEQLDVLPALSAIYKLNDNSNLRAAASQTLARPNLREISPFVSYSGISVPIYTGNPDLERTLVQNLDLRYEIYPNAGELFAVSVYYKNFDNPIVLQLTPTTTTPEIRPVNVDNGRVLGAEVEFRKSLGFISAALQNLRFSVNASFINSEADRTDEEKQVIANADRPNLEETRPFQGQSPYIVNAALFYTHPETGWESALSFNIWGERLAFATQALDPDVYDQTRPALNYTLSKRIGESYSIGFKAENLLNPKYEQAYDYSGKPVYQSYQLGRSFSLSVSYSIN